MIYPLPCMQRCKPVALLFMFFQFKFKEFKFNTTEHWNICIYMFIFKQNPKVLQIKNKKTKEMLKINQSSAKKICFEDAFKSIHGLSSPQMVRESIPQARSS